jgi:hypothetical protein
MHTNYTVELRDPRDLRLHKALRTQPGERGDEEKWFQNFSDDIRDHGIEDPLKVTAANEIVDGRHRWRVAKNLQLQTVPVRIVSDREASEYIVRMLTNRRNFTPGQMAYILAGTLDQAFSEAQKRKISGVRAPSELSSEGVPTIAQWAKTVNVTERYLRMAREIWEFFQDETPRAFGEGKAKVTATFREYYEPKILDVDDPLGLGEVKKGIGMNLSQEKRGSHKGGRPEKEGEQLRLFNEMVDVEFVRFEYWPQLSDDAKKQHFEHLREKLASVDNPTDLVAHAEYHERVAKEFRKAAKEAAAANSKD